LPLMIEAEHPSKSEGAAHDRDQLLARVLRASGASDLDLLHIALGRFDLDITTVKIVTSLNAVVMVVLLLTLCAMAIVARRSVDESVRPS